VDEPPLPPRIETVAYPRPSETPVPKAAHRAAEWLFSMAGLSVVNFIALAVGSQWSFFFSFGIVDIAGAFVHGHNAVLAVVSGVFGFFALLLAVVAGFGIKRGKTIWAYLILVPIALDCLLLFVELPASIVSLGFHAYVVFLLFGAAKELKNWNRVILG